MRGLFIINRYFIRKLKTVPRQQWVQRSQDSFVPFNERKVDDMNIKYYQDVKKDLKINISKYKAEPCSPQMGPYTIPNPKIYDKMYRWCSCGQSLKQPFCDNSHAGTKFRPFKFTIEQNVKQVNLCGCKLTKKKPFCDGKSCKPKQLTSEGKNETKKQKIPKKKSPPKNQVEASTNAAADATGTRKKSRSKKNEQNKKEEISAQKK